MGALARLAAYPRSVQHLVRGTALLLASIALAGCFDSHGRGDSEHDERFADDWAAMAAFGWALIETTTVYRLHPDGEIEVLAHREGSYFEGEAGQWVLGELSEMREAPVCTFGDRWRSEGEHLFVESECSDGIRRTLVLRLAGARLVVVEPTGATGYWESERGYLMRCDAAAPLGGDACP